MRLLCANDQSIVKEYLGFFENLKRVVIGRPDLLCQLRYALVLKEHVLIKGPPGTGKSWTALQLFRRLSGAKLFHIQCTAKMTEDSLVGPPNVKILRETGKFVHNVEDTLVQAEVAYIDEFLDLNTGALRALLEVLNERTFSRGAQHEKCPLNTCVVTTNFDRSKEDELAAVYDRFLFKNVVHPLTTDDDRIAMLLMSDTHVSPFPLGKLKKLQALLQSVQVEESLLPFYLECMRGIAVTDRTLRKLLAVARASALFAGRLSVTRHDFSSIPLALATLGDDHSLTTVGKAFSDGYTRSMKAYKDVLVAEKASKFAETQYKSALDAQTYVRFSSCYKKLQAAIYTVGQTKIADRDKLLQKWNGWLTEASVHGDQLFVKEK